MIATLANHCRVCYYDNGGRCEAVHDRIYGKGGTSSRPACYRKIVQCENTRKYRFGDGRCAETFPENGNKRFCSKQCQKEFYNRETLPRRQMSPVAMALRDRNDEFAKKVRSTEAELRGKKDLAWHVYYKFRRFIGKYLLLYYSGMKYDGCMWHGHYSLGDFKPGDLTSYLWE